MEVFKLNFVKMNPADNMTVFVIDHVPRELQREISLKIMDYSNLCCEQVAFFEPPTSDGIKKGAVARMQMMGGEFCGNAARSMAALLVDKGYGSLFNENGVTKVMLEASGINDVIECSVYETDKRNEYWAASTMPPPVDIRMNNIDDGIETYTVYMPGITHVIVDGRAFKCNRENFAHIINVLKLDRSEAVGIMFHSMEGEKHHIHPVVYIKSTDTLIFERGCGSGSAALAAVLAEKLQKNICEKIYQPGGIITAKAEYDRGCVVKLKIEGLTGIVAEGFVYI